jgi:hypothetical protein
MDESTQVEYEYTRVGHFETIGHKRILLLL